ncbi:MAG: DUF2220 family protein [Actinomycetota bacterium]|nr:DUF2220 family protein [Actinomycetota bacterium]
MTAPWSDVGDVVATLRKRWNTGRYASSYAAGTPWAPIGVPVRAPTAADLLDRFDESRRWAEKFHRDSHTPGGSERFRIEHRTVRGRSIGANTLPARIWIDSFEQLCALVGTTSHVRALDAIVDQTRSEMPALVGWVIDHPLRSVEHRELWGQALAAVAWIVDNDTEALYLRQIDAVEVDTKFVERHQKLLDELLSWVLPAERIDPRFTYADFSRRYRFRPKPEYIRFRLLSRQPGFPAGISELRLRSAELAAVELQAETVFIVENEITYLAFPEMSDAIVVFGSGYGLEGIRDLPWLEEKKIVYWGDIDTHGLSILSKLRSRFPNVASMLMDHDTLLAHPRQWVTERAPTNRPLANLTEIEGALYRDLIEDRYGHAVRLEQERVRLSLLSEALKPRTVKA